MARDYDAEILAAEEKLERIKKAKEASEQRKYMPIGKIAVEILGSKLVNMQKKELKAYFESLSEQVDTSVASEIRNEGSEGNAPSGYAAANTFDSVD